METRIERWDNCGSFATVMRAADDPKRLSIVSRKCRDRFCPTCARERSRRIAAAVSQKVKDQKHRFITLTVRHHGESLELLLTKLTNGFKKLRREPIWKTTMRAGAAFLEIKKTNGWHPHLHLITYGSYVPHQELKDAWLKVTGDSHVVSIKLIHQVQETVAYVCKYASKPLDSTVVNDEKSLIEAIEVLKNKKLLWTFGAWRGWTFNEIDDGTIWITLGSLEEYLQRARRGDWDAVEIVNKLKGETQWNQKKSEQNEEQENGQPP